ncbi:alpha/beta-hydrolase [Hyaloscypha variabilis]
MPAPVQVAWKPIDRPSIGRNNYQKFGFREEVLPEGWNGQNSRPLACEIHATHDLGIKDRDGCTLYCDVYRPADLKPVAAILAWSPFGKKFNGLTMLKNLPWGLGIPNGTLSGLEKFEGPDPAVLVPRGFAVVNVDARGSGDSDGMVSIMGTQEAEDGYDVIEAIAKMPWSLKPPSLKAIAPWEACGDLYREQFVRGGVFDSGLFDFIIKMNIQGREGVENFQEMYRRCQKADSPYWKDKRADIAKISIPTYITASYTNFVHTMGSIRGYMQVNTKNKWLRICPWQEWYDIWNCPDSTNEMAQFFDHFLNGVENGWASTPRVRSTILRFGDEPIFNIVEEDYPIPRTEYRKAYFSPNNKLSFTPPPETEIISYDSEKYLDCASFTYTFEKKTRLAGLPKAVLYVSTLASKDMDIYVLLRKLDSKGNALMNLNIPWSSIADQGASRDRIDELPKRNVNNLMFHVGSLGILRASRRAVDERRSIHENYPFHPHDRDEYLEPGEIVKMEVGIWAMGVEYEAGESIRVEVHGTSPLLRGEFEPDNPFLDMASKGIHRVHIGGKYPSHIVLPFV